jgi:molybdenum storage protein
MVEEPMSNVVGDGRTHIQSKLMRESLQDRAVLSQTDSDRDLHIFPDVSLVSIGGQSIFDRGKAAILPLVDELIEIKKDRALKLVLGVGGGTRVRHTMSIALDLGLPVGGVAQLVGAMEELNAILLNTLLAPHGSMPMQRDHFWDLPLYFDAGITPIAISIPPYHFWEPPPSARGTSSRSRTRSNSSSRTASRWSISAKSAPTPRRSRRR